ncbi:MAG: malto-oligosyltrehalose synthase, partial [Spirochaetota bacterium]
TELVMRFQQFTGPAMAKGGEDTALYRYHRLTALNEVGGEPGRFGSSLEEFHAAMAGRAGTQPSAMLATSTHDTKRSEDVRARLALLSEIPRAWEEAVFRWAERAGKHRAGGIPDSNTEYLLYQTMVGAWPLDRERAEAYLEKAAREAKVHTSWTDPDPAYEEGLRGFVHALYQDRELMDDLASFAAGLVAPGRINSLAQTLIKLTAPGVPDIYQGCELWDLSLVDPDNRRPVDFELRRALLRELEELEAGCGEELPERILQHMDRGLPKLWVVRQALRLRAERPGLFAPGSSYSPLPVSGDRCGHLVAFLRCGGTGGTWSPGGTVTPAGTGNQAGARAPAGAAAVLAPRFPMLLGGSWQDTGVELPGGDWCNLLTGERVTGGPAAAGDLLGRFPVALLAAGG